MRTGCEMLWLMQASTKTEIKLVGQAITEKKKSKLGKLSSEGPGWIGWFNFNSDLNDTSKPEKEWVG